MHLVSTTVQLDANAGGITPLQLDARPCAANNDGSR